MGLEVYLDHHSATPPCQQGIDLLLPILRNNWAALSSPHQLGQEAAIAFCQFMDEGLQELGGAKDDQLHLCHSGAEAINSVFFSHYLEEMRESGKNHVLTTNIEDAPTLLGLKRLEKLHCVEKMIAVNEQGQITAAMLEEAVKPRTSLLSISWANPLTGVIHPIADLAEVCQQKGIKLHVDASYVIGKLFLHFEDLAIDYLTFDGSLFHAPKGCSGVLVKAKNGFHPLAAGHVDKDVGAAAALSASLAEAAAHFDHMNLETARLRDELERGVLAEFEEAIVLFKDVERLPNTTVIAFPGVESEALLYLLNQHGVYASMGGGRMQKLSQVLLACKVDEKLAHCALSFTLSHTTTQEEIAYAVQAIVKSAQLLKKCSLQIWGDCQ